MVGKVTRDDRCSASILPTLAGISPYGNANEVLQVALGIKERNIANSEVMDMGNILEPVIATEACKRLGIDAPKLDYPEAFDHPDIPISCSLDATAEGDSIEISNHIIDKGIYLMNCDSIKLEGEGIIECKNTSGLPEAEPAEWRGPLQLQGQFLATNKKYKWGAVAVLYKGNTLRIFLYKPDEKQMNFVADLAQDFQNRIDLYKKNEEIMWYPVETAENAAATWNEGSGEDLFLPEVESTAKEIVKLKDQIKKSEQKLSKLQASVMEKMRDAEYATAGKYRVIWKSVNRKETPERIIPAKPAYTYRMKTLTIKETKDESGTV